MESFDVESSLDTTADIEGVSDDAADEDRVVLQPERGLESEAHVRQVVVGIAQGVAIEADRLTIGDDHCGRSSSRLSVG